MMTSHDDSTGRTPARSSWVRVGGVAIVIVIAVLAARLRAGQHPPHLAGLPTATVMDMLRAVGIGVVAGGLLLLTWGARRFGIRRVVVVSAAKKRKLSTGDRQQLWVAALFGLLAALGYQLVMRMVSPAGTDDRGQQNQAQGAPPQDNRGLIDMHGQIEPHSSSVSTYLTAGGAIVAILALAAILLYRRRTIEVTPEEVAEAEVFARALAAGRDVVRDRSIMSPRDAIVACFAAVEHKLRELGDEAAPHIADTPEEVFHRGLQAAHFPEAPTRTLLELFREARFSEHPMRERERERADKALSEILAALPADPDAPRRHPASS
jgi:hypothetical protein